MAELSLAAIAAGEYARRQELARRKVDAGELQAAEADALLRPWLAIACAFGAELPELAPFLAPFRLDLLDPTHPIGKAAFQLAALDICLREDRIAALATARDQALERWGDPSAPADRRERARKLCRLADAAGCPPFVPAAMASGSAAAGQQGIPA